MMNEYRSPDLIIKELLDVQELIRKNKQFVKIYPNDYGLKLNLYSFEARENKLLCEFQDSLVHYQVDGFDISIEGKNVKENSISMISLGETLVKMQNLVTSIVYKESTGSKSSEPIPVAIRDAANINVVATASGSFRVILSAFSPQQQIQNSMVRNALEILNELIDCKDNKELMKAQTLKLGNRVVNRYKQLLKTIYTNDENLILYEKVKPKDFVRREISFEDARKVYYMLDKQEKEAKETLEYYGILKGIDLLSYKCKFQVDEHKPISAKFEHKLADKLKKYLDEYATAKFTVIKIWNESTDETDQNWELVDLTGN